MHLNPHILEVKDIYKYQIQKFVYESLNNTCIIEFHNFYTYTNDIHPLNTRQQNQLHRARIKTKYGEHSLKYYGAGLWNSLRSDIKQSKSLYTFKKALRQSIINNYET